MKTIAKIFGLTGTNAAGKGEVAAFFMKKGYDYFSLSDVVREECLKEGLMITRDNLIAMGNNLRQKHGPDILARKILKKVKGKAVIDSIRNPEEVKFLKTRENFFLIAVDAPADLRFKRAKKRGRDESASTLEEFTAKEKEEMSEGRNRQQLHRCMEMADVVIFNDGSLDELYLKLESLL
ncbi:MAG: AAA family ATPase [Candidatus Aminicenantes bacterium]|nr:AAA family ATPase [Candidatus Aminicenantes bacterium]